MTKTDIQRNTALLECWRKIDEWAKTAPEGEYTVSGSLVLIVEGGSVRLEMSPKCYIKGIYLYTDTDRSSLKALARTNRIPFSWIAELVRSWNEVKAAIITREEEDDAIYSFEP